jgi:hypothetical protein
MAEEPESQTAEGASTQKGVEPESIPAKKGASRRTATRKATAGSDADTSVSKPAAKRTTSRKATGNKAAPSAVEPPNVEQEAPQVASGIDAMAVQEAHAVSTRQSVLDDKLQELGVKVGDQAEPTMKAAEFKPSHANGSDKKMSSESSNHDKSFWFQIALGIAVVVMVFIYIKSVAEKPAQQVSKPATSHQAPAKVVKKPEVAPVVAKQPQVPAAASVVKVDAPVPVVEEKAAPKVAEAAVSKTETKPAAAREPHASEGGSIWLSKLGLDDKKAEAPADSSAVKTEERRPPVEQAKTEVKPEPQPVVAPVTEPAQVAQAPVVPMSHGMMPPVPPHAKAPGREEAPAWAKEHMNRIEQLRNDLNSSMQQMREEGRKRMEEERKLRDEQRKQEVPEWMRAHMERAEQLRNELRKEMDAMQSAMREHRGENMPQQQPDLNEMRGPGYPQGPYYGPNSGYAYPAYRY